MRIPYNDPFVQQLSVRIRELIDSPVDVPQCLREEIESSLTDLAVRNLPEIRAYWCSAKYRLGVPDTAFRGALLYYFPDQAPARIFRTSGTSGRERGAAAYSPLGMELMNASIRQSAARSVITDVDRPAIIRIAPSAQQAPDMVMAYGMELIASHFGHPDLSACLWTEHGVDLTRLKTLLGDCVREGAPTILIGATFGFVRLFDALKQDHFSIELPAGSRIVDAGGHKGHGRALAVSELHRLAGARLGVTADRCVNLFGMTELASQLYDGSTAACGPLGERPKAACPYARPIVRDLRTMQPVAAGHGLLEVIDACVIDRPFAVLSGDVAIAGPDGAAIIGRAPSQANRGCSLAFVAASEPREAAA